MVGSFVNDKLDKMWEEAEFNYLKVGPQRLYKSPEKLRNLSHDSQSLR
jgi:hypothetical protein